MTSSQMGLRMFFARILGRGRVTAGGVTGASRFLFFFFFFFVGRGVVPVGVSLCDGL